MTQTKAVNLTKHLLIDGPDDASHVLLLAHGAGAGMDHEFMTSVAQHLAKAGILVVRFEFPYMIKRRADGRKYPPDRAPKALLAFAEVTRYVQSLYTNKKLFIGGKSMGGRLASLLVGEDNAPHNIEGIICLGFPFVAPAKPDVYRGEQLNAIEIPTLIIQGERDNFGGREAIESYQFSDQVSYKLLPDGDHSFKPRVKSGYTLAQNITTACDTIIAFMTGKPL